MSLDSEPWFAHLPTLSDRSAVELLDFLHEFVLAFESFYGGQIHRFYEKRSPANLIQPEPDSPIDDPPF